MLSLRAIAILRQNWKYSSGYADRLTAESLLISLLSVSNWGSSSSLFTNRGKPDSSFTLQWRAALQVIGDYPPAYFDFGDAAT